MAIKKPDDRHRRSWISGEGSHTKKTQGPQKTGYNDGTRLSFTANDTTSNKGYTLPVGRVNMQNLRQPLQLGTTYLFRTQLYEFLSNITNEQYSRSCPIVGGSCGQHVRHVFDHFECVTSNFKSVSSYDTFRNRNSTLETSLEISKTKLDELEQQTMHILKMENLHQCIQVSFLTGGTEVEFESTLARELSFCLHHSYHHCASMKLIAFNNGFREAVPSGFGVAPSTSVYNNKG